MTAASDNSYTALSIADNSSIDGTIVYNNKTYTAAALYIGKAQATSGDLALEMTIYFKENQNDEDFSMAINFTYNGQGVETQQ